MANETSGAPGRRRKPKRRTGAAIVDAVVEATERILTSRGLAGLTTKQIAKISGVSSGSIYQYFESKQGIVAELARRLEARARSVALERLADARPTDLRGIVRAFVGALLADHMGHDRMRRALLLEIPRGWIEENSAKVDAELQVMVATMIRESTEVRSGDPTMMAFVAHHAIEAVVEAAVMRQPDWLTDERFRRELELLATRYVAKEA